MVAAIFPAAVLASFVPAIAAVALKSASTIVPSNIFAEVTALAAMVSAPTLEMVASPEIVCSVATFDQLPINILEFVRTLVNFSASSSLMAF